jgi:5-oxoprolinase (ATP-hydrolysing) subunit C
VTASSLRVQRVMGLVMFQDLGRPGRMHLAVPPGGALVPELLVAANRRVGNPDDATCLEVQGRLVIHVAVDVDYAIDDRDRRRARANETIDVSSGPRRCTYLAVRGGLVGDPTSIASGTTLGIADVPVTSPGVTSTFVDGDLVSIIPGPDLDAFDPDALETLTSMPYRILPASNRVGTRLAGLGLPRRTDYRERSRPMVQGALEVPRDGQPIVLGPEHPTTGGYPVIGVIASAELGRFHAIRLGGGVRFRVATGAGAVVTSSR